MASAKVMKMSVKGATAPPPSLTSSQGLLALLDERDSRLRAHALRQLDMVVPDMWFEVSSAITTIEALYEDEDFQERELAALLASKVFYHLGEFQESLTYALCAGPLFDVTEQSDYVQSIVGKCIDEYMKLRAKADASSEPVAIDARLEDVVQRMFDRCLHDSQLEQAVGVALDSHRLDMLERVVEHSSFDEATLSYALRVSQELIVSRKFRESALRKLIELHGKLEVPDWVTIAQCLMLLDEPKKVAGLLTDLLAKGGDAQLLCYQIAFQLFENEQPQFLGKVCAEIKQGREAAPASAGAEGAGQESAPMETGGEGEEREAEGEQAGEDTPLLAGESGGPAADPPAPKEEQPDPAMEKLMSILQGDAPIKLHLEFLYNNNHADVAILKQLKSAVEQRNSVCHSAIILCNALMHMGTTVDAFLRENLDWLARATNWAKFGATAGLGVIHRGQLSQGQNLMAPYLPSEGSSGSPYSEGGALYALGLMHCDKGEAIREFLRTSLRGAMHEVVQHGACLGSGLANLGTDDEETFEDLKNVLYTDSAVAGEAAGLAMGLLSAGTASDKTEQMLTYAHDTQHEKITRGLAVGCALVVCGREEEADTLIEQLSGDQDPIMRYGGMFAIGLAYRGTMNNGAIQRLLHYAVSDVSDDVRRAAVMCLGFVMYTQHEQCPGTVALLSESFNPHVRYGVAMALGISCAGTGLKEAASLLDTLASDPVDFVRQGALIAMAMVMVQQPEAKVGAFRKKLDKVVGDKHEDVMCKMGGIIAMGIIDAGGRNVNIRLQSRSGFPRLISIVGMALFTQYWYWYPLSYFVSLPLAPTALIGLNSDLQMPKMGVLSKCKPSLFAYAPPLQTASTVRAKVPTAVLSTTHKAKARAARKLEEKASAAAAAAASAGGSAMEVDAPEPKKEAEAKEETKGEDAEAASAAKAAADATEEVKQNPARVVPAQEPYISFLGDSRFVPVSRQVGAGLLVLRDTKPGEPFEVAASSAPASVSAGGDDNEPPPPEPFEYNPDAE